MIARFCRELLNGIVVAIPLIVTGLLAAVFLFEDWSKIEITLFGLGSVPIIIFLPAVFSKSTSGALHTPKVIFRKVETLERRQEREPVGKKPQFPPRTFVIAGLLTWLAGYIIALLLI